MATVWWLELLSAICGKERENLWHRICRQKGGDGR